MPTNMQQRLRLVLVSVAMILSACATQAPTAGNEPVAISFDKEQMRRCQPLGEVVGSKGAWYSSWLIANEALITGALDDLRNKARRLNADTVFVPEYPLLFATSVTLLGQAMRCKAAP